MAADIDRKLGRDHHAALLQRRVAFHQARQPDTHEEALRAKYTPINAVHSNRQPQPQPQPQHQSKQHKQHKQLLPPPQQARQQPKIQNQQQQPAEAELPVPKRVLFPVERVLPLLQWAKAHPIGPGLQNLGNTCFLNSVLQCLTYTPPLNQFLLTGTHSRECKLQTFCLMCEMEAHVRRCTQHKANQSITPSSIVGKLRHVAKNMHVGRQEDAHEYMRFFVEALQKSCLSDAQGLDNRSKETTFVYGTFAGYLRSQVQCLSCKFRSNTFDAFLDLSLDILHADSIAKALNGFTKPERLEGDNQYHCSRCRTKVNAIKRFTIHQAPNVLSLQLKRFDFLRSSGQKKVGRPISFPETLDITQYLSVPTTGPPPQPVKYKLYGVLVHSGHSVHSGHYFSFVRSSAGIWYSMNDTSVSQVGVHNVLKQQAYMLFYVRDSAGKPPAPVQPAHLTAPSLKRPLDIPHLGASKGDDSDDVSDDESSQDDQPAAPPAKRPNVDEGEKRELAVSGTWIVRPVSKTPFVVSAKTNGVTNDVTNGVQSLGAKTNGVTNGVQSLGAKTNGVTNGVQSLGAKTNGVTNGVQSLKTNGVTNGVQSVKTNGVTNGVQSVKTNGVTNGVQSAKTNGVTNGVQSLAAKTNGVTNGVQSAKTSNHDPQALPINPFAPQGIPAAHAKATLFGDKVASWNDDDDDDDGKDDDEKVDTVKETRRQELAARDQLLQQQAREESKARRAKMLDERDVEYDLGRVKKVKTGLNKQGNSSKPVWKKGNQFQRMQNNKFNKYYE